MKRAAGILMPLFSLPSNYGCGALDKEAYRFVDWLAAAGQSYWQMLPINHVGCGDSPYCCFSSYAGDPLFVSLDELVKEQLLESSETASVDWGNDASHIDHEKVKAGRERLFVKAFGRFKADEDYLAFTAAEARWLVPYASFMAEKSGIEPEVYKFIQYKFYRQWAAFKAYAASKGVMLIGDVPVYVPLDSADVKAEPEFFMLGDGGEPELCAGVPPDYFNSEGQLWGNPLYDWEALKKDGYGWWIRRIDAVLKLFDIVRIDHFRAFDSYWAVPCTEKSAKNGRWLKGPGLAFVEMLCSWFGRDRFIAEDLGILSDSARKLLSDSGLPGMKILEFAFGEDMTSSYLPHYYNENCICYTGTHDNAPVMQWKDEAAKEELANAMLYCSCGAEDLNRGMIKIGMASVAKLFIAQLQDYLGLGSGSRTNIPGTAFGNWRWRVLPGQLTDELAAEIKKLTGFYGRS